MNLGLISSPRYSAMRFGTEDFPDRLVDKPRSSVGGGSASGGEAIGQPHEITLHHHVGAVYRYPAVDECAAHWLPP